MLAAAIRPRCNQHSEAVMSDEVRTLEIGDRVIFHDPEGNPHNALVNCIHDAVDDNGVWTQDMPHCSERPDVPWRSEEDEEWRDEVGYDRVREYEDGPLVNLVILSDDEERTDSYGRQIERPTSISHASDNKSHGNYWRWPDEDPNSVTPSHS